MTGNKKLFLSAVSSELVSYRNLLAADLKRPNLDVAVQEDFVVAGGTTLDKLDTYLRHCDAVIHLIGKAAGAVPEEPAVAALLAKYPKLGTRLPPLADAAYFLTRNGSAPPCSGTWSKSFPAWNRPRTLARPSCGTRPSGSSAATKT